eukprot:9277536-Heterocapsa_arctica.AAC.1
MSELRRRAQAEAGDIEKITIKQILVSCEDKLAFPAQTLLNEVILIGKPGPAKGDRPITLTCSLYRLYNYIRKPFISAWEQEHFRHWDSAVKGSSALRAAMISELKGEISLRLGTPTLQICWDVEK